MGSIYSIYHFQIHSLKVQQSHSEAQEYAWISLDMMVREIRYAGYAPTGAACAGVVVAEAQTLQFRYDSNADSDCVDAGEDINYAYDDTNLDITRAVNAGTAESLTDGNATNLQFTYYPQQTSSTDPPPFCFSPGNPPGCSGDLAANLANIKRILIAVAVQSNSPDIEFGGTLTVTMTCNVALRN